MAGPFTVESLSPHRVLGVDEDDELIDNLADAELGYGEAQDFATIILEHLKTSGVQQAHKEDRISFTSIKPWPGNFVCAEGRYVEGDPDSGRRETRRHLHSVPNLAPFPVPTSSKLPARRRTPTLTS